MPPNLLSGRTFSKLEKDTRLYQSPASLSSKEVWKRSESHGCESCRIGHCKGTPALTCHYFTAKCFPAKYTRALSHSATVCAGNRATITVSVQLEQSSEGAGGGGGVSYNKEKASPTLLQAENTTLHILGFLVKNFTRQEGSKGEEIKVLSLYYSLIRTKPGRGTQNLIRKTYFFFN